MNNVEQYLSFTVYEVSKDVATNKVNYLVKSETSGLPVVGVSVCRTSTPASYNELKRVETSILEQAGVNPESVEFFPIYPLDPKYPELYDEQHQFTVVKGTYLKLVKPNHDKPYTVPGDATPEQRTQALKDALQPTVEEIPFVALFPETENYMFDFKISYTPVGAVTEWDSSKVTTDPLLNKESETVPFASDPTGYQPSKLDETLAKVDPLAKAVHEATQS